MVRMRMTIMLPVLCLLVLEACTGKAGKGTLQDQAVQDSVEVALPAKQEFIPKEIVIEKELLYDQHTLADIYPYKDTTRQFQWDKIRECLSLVDSIQRKPATWGILQNYKNKNNEAPLVKKYSRDAYRRIADTLGVERFQGIPLYLPGDTITPELYGKDGSLVQDMGEEGQFLKLKDVYSGEEWWVPRKYVGAIPDTVVFDKVIIVDRRDQNIITLEHVGSKWLIRSMNPATTGLHRPPYAQETPLGLFVIQEKKNRMIYLVDGTTETGGFAPYASRFTNGGYIHGVPVNAPRTTVIEYSPSLGTTPRSHMCVRNATSHAKFIYDWAPVNEALVFVLE